MKRAILCAIVFLSLAVGAGVSDRIPEAKARGGMGDPTVWCPPFCR